MVKCCKHSRTGRYESSPGTSRRGNLTSSRAYLDGSRKPASDPIPRPEPFVTNSPFTCNQLLDVDNYQRVFTARRLLGSGETCGL
ncbi:hypothetical protein J6590_042502 [Homalodisca vitripennis]|nr:hypothetical protein J6590_042502 [Homalodisca vitripennis]